MALLVGGIAWSDQIPIYASAPGIILDQHSTAAADQHDTVAALFFAAGQFSKVKVGQRAVVHIGASKEELASQIIKIEPAVVSPNTIYQRYGFVAQVVTQPSIVVLIQLKNIPTATYAGSMIVANVQTGSQRIISMLPGLGNIVGGRLWMPANKRHRF
ncbi:hypothetical protein KDK_72900 [Dictyobacter kobayashii]|uniref:Uncharacterized protein n=1 Tax=Dictyobacter kobayashii TaxID=2014872 RepID=A0A402AWG6_9CHLR|nr:hypothetical protein KDK_72900 [Dictyobacter kobayashii]